MLVSRAFDPGSEAGPSVGENNVIALVLMRADGTHARQITQQGADPAVQQPYADLDPTWLPSARRLAFERVGVKDSDHPCDCGFGRAGRQSDWWNPLA